MTMIISIIGGVAPLVGAVGVTVWYIWWRNRKQKIASRNNQPTYVYIEQEGAPGNTSRTPPGCATFGVAPSTSQKQLPDLAASSRGGDIQRTARQSGPMYENDATNHPTPVHENDSITATTSSGTLPNVYLYSALKKDLDEQDEE